MGHVEASIAIVVLKYVTECITLSVGQKKTLLKHGVLIEFTIARDVEFISKAPAPD